MQRGQLISAFCIVLSLVEATCPLAATELLLPRDQYGKVNLTLNQSLIDHKQTVVSGNGNYEALSQTPPQDRLRILSRPIGRLDVLYAKGSSFCTAAVVSSEYILTNYHCIDGSKGNGKVEKLSIVMGFFSQLEADQTQRFAVDPRPVEFDQDLDFALLKVAGDPSKQWGKLQFQDRDPYPGESLMLIHHPLGLPLHVTRGRCRAAQPKAYSGTDIFHTCDTEAGSSGSPLLTTDGAAMLGLHFSGVFGDQAYNRGKRLTEILSKFSRLKQIAQTTTNAPVRAVNSPPLFTNQPQNQGFELTVSAAHPKDTVFLKSSFASLEQMNQSGCESIKRTLKQQAEQACAAKQASLQSLDYQACDHSGRNVRRYSVKGLATCR